MDLLSTGGSSAKAIDHIFDKKKKHIFDKKMWRLVPDTLPL
jgi:hypothetical protein